MTAQASCKACRDAAWAEMCRGLQGCAAHACTVSIQGDVPRGLLNWTELGSTPLHSGAQAKPLF